VSALVRVTGLDHIVLRVADVERSLAFYVERLGLVPDRVDEWRAGEVPFPSVRVDATTLIDLFPAGEDEPAGRNLDHCCLVVESTDLAALAASGEVDVAGGPATLYGAQGMGEGLYVRDPDGNVIELRQYGPA
jgi:catechol 2,3-dioxygenase-like lactoylglutathione lyase family enzyme